MNKEDAVETRNIYGSLLDEYVEGLIKMREQGKNVFFNFNGHKLYSADVTMDSAYLEVCGCTKKEFDIEKERQQEEWEKRRAKEEAEAQAKIPTWIAEGKKLIDKDLWDDWEECVSIRANDLYHGFDLDAFLEIAKGMKDKSIKSKQDVEKILDEQGNSG